jgi:large-conductance mechanosensitive channel
MGNLHLKVGNFLGSLLDFIIIALVIFLFTKMILRDEA